MLLAPPRAASFTAQGVVVNRVSDARHTFKEVLRLPLCESVAHAEQTTKWLALLRLPQARASTMWGSNTG